jgi:uncharacterized DUF497 family protein
MSCRVQDGAGGGGHNIYGIYFNGALPVGPSEGAAERRQHGVPFDAAMTAFDDPFALVATDDAHSTPEEPREWLIGQSDRVVLVVVFTKRANGEVYRILSARRASRRERQQYEDTRDFPI